MLTFYVRGTVQVLHSDRFEARLQRTQANSLFIDRCPVGQSESLTVVSGRAARIPGLRLNTTSDVALVVLCCAALLAALHCRHQPFSVNTPASQSFDGIE